MAAAVEGEYCRALVLAATETELPTGTFAACPFSAEQVLNDDWWHEASASE